MTHESTAAAAFQKQDGRPYGRTCMIERWSPVAGFDDYEVSDKGCVWSHRTERVLTGTPCKGYMNVRLTKDGRTHLRPIHRLVCIAFHGPCPADKEMVGHLDGNKINNCVENLAWITRSENTLHSIAHGTFAGKPPYFHLKGEAHPGAKLSAKQVAEIRESPMGHKPIARLYGVSDTQIRRIRSGKKWRLAGSRFNRALG